MKCPLLILAYTYVPGPTAENVGDCLKEECAWWNSHTGECVAMSIDRILNHLSDYIYDIKTKMPHEGQFRR